jgi:hypothetical protein
LSRIKQTELELITNLNRKYKCHSYYYIMSCIVLFSAIPHHNIGIL